MARNEPAMIAETVRLVLLALVALGVITIDSAALDAVIAAVAAVVSVLLSVWTRQRVTPMRPRSVDTSD